MDMASLTKKEARNLLGWFVVAWLFCSFVNPILREFEALAMGVIAFAVIALFLTIRD
jgi:hypothetical protein